jgi:hypothetical protein
MPTALPAQWASPSFPDTTNDMVDCPGSRGQTVASSRGAFKHIGTDAAEMTVVAVYDIGQVITDSAQTLREENTRLRAEVAYLKNCTP